MAHGLVYFGLAVSLLGLLGVGVMDYLTNVDQNECSMTYMFQMPNLMPITLGKRVQDEYPLYQLFLYCEGDNMNHECDQRFNQPGLVPVLFITGNADSHKQVRSLASVALDKFRHQPHNSKIKFHYFTLSFNEELSALYGPTLSKQVNFAKESIKHILGLYSNVRSENRPKSVIVIGNSMGGLVARGLFVPSKVVDFDSNWVHTIITQASPHLEPVINYDSEIDSFYKRVNEFWRNETREELSNVVLVSLYGGVRDYLVRSGLANLNPWRSKSRLLSILATQTTSIPHVWRSVDHRCMAWCKELVLVTNRALFELIDPTTKQVRGNKSERERILRFYFERGIQDQDEIDSLSFKVDRDIEIVQTTEIFNLLASDKTLLQPNKDKTYAISTEQVINSIEFDSLFVYTNLNNINLLVLCKSFEKRDDQGQYICSSGVDLVSRYGRLAPSNVDTNRQFTLNLVNIVDLKSLLITHGFQYLLINLPARKLNHPTYIKFDFYFKQDRIDSNPGQARSWSVQSDQEVFRRVYLPYLRHVWQVYDLNKLFTRDTNACELYLEQSKKPTIMSSCLLMQFYEPTSREQVENKNEHVYYSQTAGRSKNLTLRLTRSIGQNELDLIPYIDLVKFDMKHLLPQLSDSKLKQAQFSYRIEVTTNLIATLGQFSRFYLPLLPSFLVIILNIYHITVTIFPSKNNSSRSILLYDLNSRLKLHFTASLICMALTHAAPYLSSIAGLEFILYDINKLYNESNMTFSGYIAVILYWLAWSILNLLCWCLSPVVYLCGLMTEFAPSRLFHIIALFAVMACGFISGTPSLSLLPLLIYQLFIVCKSNQNGSLDIMNQIRLIITLVFVALHAPGIIVWVKSQSSDDIFSIRSLSATFDIDSGYHSASLFLLIILAHIALSRRISIMGGLTNHLFANLIMINCFSGLLRSLTSLYMMNMFILVHLALDCFVSVPAEEIANEKKSQ